MGLGVLGRGVNVAKFLLSHGAQLTITDLKSREQLAISIDQLEDFEDRITYVLGEHREENFRNADIVVKAAGVPLDSQYIKAGRDSGVPVKMDASWTVQLLPEGVVTIGITGTKGKSTVTHLIYHILNEALRSEGLNHSHKGMSGRNTRQSRVFLGGNVKGKATLPILDQIRSGDILVMELDSWQLQGFHDEKISPNIAVFTNFMPDHLNYYKGMPEYYRDKSAIYKYQSKGDYLVLSENSFSQIQKYDANFKSKATKAVMKPNLIPGNWKFSQPGEHNRINAGQAYQVAKFLDIDDELIKKALETFLGVPGRLEKISEINGIEFYNDTNATTPEAVSASLRALESKEIYLIAGGVSKGSDYTEMIRTINETVHKVFLFTGGVAQIVKPKLKVPFTEIETMTEGVQKAYGSAIDSQGEPIILMSPGGSSFGHFKNEYDRGDQFNVAVKNI